MPEFYLGQIIMGGWNFATRGTMLCDGQLLPISQYSALFSLFGTAYGGDGRTDFGIPDLKGRSPIGVGQGAGLQNYKWGAKGGTDFLTLGIANMPSHNHIAGGGLTIGGAKGKTDKAKDGYLGDSIATDPIYRTAAGAGTTKGGEGITISHTGSGRGFNNRGPYLPIYYAVTITGIYPSRS